MRVEKPETTPEGVVEHHPACGARCAPGCHVSPRSPWRDPKSRRPPRTRTLCAEKPEPLKREPPPLWEHGADIDAARRSGVSLPSLDGPARALDERQNLDRWTRDGGIEDGDLLVAIRAFDSERKRRGRTRRESEVHEIADTMRAAFPATTGAKPSPAVRKRPQKAPSEETRLLLDLVLNAAPAEPVEAAQHATMREATEDIRAAFTGVVWALGLLLFGRESDPLSDYALGRLLPGAPLRDLRPPFRSPAHVLAASETPLPGLGGGACVWPSDDPRMRRRVHALPGEMAVKATFAGSASTRGEAQVNRALDARMATRRAGLTTHELAAVRVLTSDLTRDEKATAVRQIDAQRQGIAVEAVDVGAAMRAARAALGRVEAAVARQSREGDAMMPGKPAKVPRPPRLRGPDPEPYAPSDGEVLAHA